MTFISRLPIESRLAKNIAGPEATWSGTEYMLALLIDQVAVSNYYAALGLWGRSKRSTAAPKPPKPLPRPGDDIEKASKPRMSSTAELKRFFGKG